MYIYILTVRLSSLSLLPGREGFLLSKYTIVYTLAHMIAIIATGKDHEVRDTTSMSFLSLIYSVALVARTNNSVPVHYT